MSDSTPLPPSGRGVGAGRGATETFVPRAPGAERRLSSSVRMSDQVDSALRGLDEQLAAYDVRDPDGSLRATARSALVVAYAVPEYDVAIAPARGRVAVRIKHSELGLEVHVVELGARGQRAREQPPSTAGPPSSSTALSEPIGESWTPPSP